MLDITLAFLWLVFISYWIISAGRSSKKTQRYQKVIWGGVSARVTLAVLIIVLWTVPLFSYPLYSSALISEIIGILICIGGLLFSVWARETLGRNWSANPAETKEDHKLIVTGPYSIVRHPIYTGEIVALTGSLIAIGEVNILILLIVFTIGVFMRARIEDKVMLQAFPGEYPDYKKKTSSLIPGIY